MGKQVVHIDRKTASDLLRVSVRTIDRYIKSGRLRAKYDGGRVWLDKGEILELPRTNNQNFISPHPYTATTQNVLTNHDNFHNDDYIHSYDTFYKELYEEAKNALKEYQNELTKNKMRIETLEEQIKFTVNHNTQPNQNINHYLSPADIGYLKIEISEKDKEIKSLKDALNQEKVNKTAFVIITYLLLLMIPILWVVLR